MSDLSLIPIQDGFETQLSQEWNGAIGTVYVLATPSYTPTTTNTYIVVNPGKTNMQIAEITDYDSTAKTLTVSSISFYKGLGISSTQQTHTTGSKVIISDNYQFWADIKTAINSKLDKNGGNVQTYATTADRDTALGGDGVATLPYSDIYVTATGLFYNYNLNLGQWQVVSTGTAPANATTSTAGVMKTDVAPSGVPVAQTTDNPKYAAQSGAGGTPSASNLFETQYDTSNASTKTATTISFVSGTKTIADSGNGFVTAGFKQGTQITITGTASNNGTYTIVSVAAGAIVTAESLVTESAGASVVMTTITASKLARYDSNSDLIVPATPGSANAAASKYYVLAQATSLQYIINAELTKTYKTRPIPILRYNVSGFLYYAGWTESSSNFISGSNSQGAGGVAEIATSSGGYIRSYLAGVKSGTGFAFRFSDSKKWRLSWSMRIGGGTHRTGVGLTTGGTEIYADDTDTSVHQMRLVFDDTTLKVACSNGSNYSSATSTNTITKTNWNDYALNFDGTNLGLYVNGTLEATVSSNLPTSSSALFVSFGQSATSTTYISDILFTQEI